MTEGEVEENTNQLPLQNLLTSVSKSSVETIIGFSFISGTYPNHLHCYKLKRQLFDSANDWIYKKPDIANSLSQESSAYEI